jgi:hypothetical protein
VTRIIDLRLILDRSDELTVRVDGRVVDIPPTSDPCIALSALARRLDALSWSTQRPALELLADPSALASRAP